MKKLLFLFLLISSVASAQKVTYIKAPRFTKQVARATAIPSFQVDTSSKIRKQIAPQVLRRRPYKLGPLGIGPCGGTTYLLNPPSDGYGSFMQGSNPGAGFYFPLGPGDTVILGNTHTWSYFAIESFAGTASCPIVVINQNTGATTLTAGFDLRNVQYVKVTGTGSGAFYGFKAYGTDFSSVGVPISVQGKSKVIVVDHVDVFGQGYGAWLKQDPLCDSSYNYPHYTMDSLELAFCRFKRIFQDIVYAGNTDPNGRGFRYYGCYGGLVQFIPMRISNVNIHDNILDSAGRTGIQVSGALDGYNRVWNNTITGMGYEWNQQQGTGISIGGMAQVHVFNNHIKNTFVYGILSLGVGTNIIEDNDIDSSGFLNADPFHDIDSLAASHSGLQVVGPHIIRNSFSQPTNIWLDTRPTTSSWGLNANNRGIEFDSVRYIIRNNSLGRDANGNSTIEMYMTEGSLYYTSRNLVCDNTSTIGSVVFHQRCQQDPLLVPCVNILTDCNVPHAYAGSDRTISTDTTRLAGFGVPVFAFEMETYNWQKISGPGTTSMPNPNKSIVQVSGLEPGVYVFRLTVGQKGGLTATDDVKITVSGTPVQQSDHFKLQRGTKIL